MWCRFVAMEELRKGQGVQKARNGLDRRELREESRRWPVIQERRDDLNICDMSKTGLVTQSRERRWARHYRNSGPAS